MLLLLVWYFLNYLWGCRENERIKILFLKEFEGLFREQFAHVGPGCVSGMDGNGGWGNGSSLDEVGEKEAHNGEEKKGLVMHKVRLGDRKGMCRISPPFSSLSDCGI